MPAASRPVRRRDRAPGGELAPAHPALLEDLARVDDRRHALTPGRDQRRRQHRGDDDDELGIAARGSARGTGRTSAASVAQRRSAPVATRRLRQRLVVRRDDARGEARRRRRRPRPPPPASGTTTWSSPSPACHSSSRSSERDGPLVSARWKNAMLEPHCAAWAARSRPHRPARESPSAREPPPQGAEGARRRPTGSSAG